MENWQKRLRRLNSIDEMEEDVFNQIDLRKEALAKRKDKQNSWLLAHRTFAMFDLEATNLNADIGEILCACIKPLDGGITTIVSRDDDKRSSALIRDELKKYDYVVTWYGSRYDMPFLATRLLLNEHSPLGYVRHVDLYYTAKMQFKFHSNRLDAVGEGLFGESKKTRLRGGLWNDARSPNRERRRKAMEYIIDHCQKDVEELESIFKELVPFRQLASTPLRRF
jgi:uncharacterized protein YprB with RNaseH-like and TPR domain